MFTFKFEDFAGVRNICVVWLCERRNLLFDDGLHISIHLYCPAGPAGVRLKLLAPTGQSWLNGREWIHKMRKGAGRYEGAVETSMNQLDLIIVVDTIIKTCLEGERKVCYHESRFPRYRARKKRRCIGEARIHVWIRSVDLHFVNFRLISEAQFLCFTGLYPGGSDGPTRDQVKPW